MADENRSRHVDEEQAKGVYRLPNLHIRHQESIHVSERGGV